LGALQEKKERLGRQKTNSQPRNLKDGGLRSRRIGENKGFHKDGKVRKPPQGWNSKLREKVGAPASAIQEREIEERAR